MFRLRSIALPRLAAASAVLFLLAAPACAFDGLLRTADGKLASGYQVSVVGSTVTVTTNSEGRFRIVPSPAVPFVLIATGPGGAVSAPIEVNELADAGVVELIIPEVFKDAITVVAGVAPSIDTPPAAATVVLAQESLEQQRPNRLADALEGVAGVSRTDQSTTAVPVIRGLGRGRTLVLLDGARVTTERRAGASASFLDPFTLASIEVARGAGSVTYGSDAMGGVIHAQPRYPEPGAPGLHVMVNQAFGSEDETSAGVEISRDALGGALLAQVTYREADEQEAGGGETIADSAYGDHSAALRYTVFLGTGRLRVGLFAAEAEDVGKPASDSDTIHTLYPQETSERFNVAYEGGPVGGWESLGANFFFGRYRLITDRDRVATATALRLLERSDVDANDASLRGVASRAIWGGRLRVGSEVVSRFDLEAIASRRTFDAAGNVVTSASVPAVEDASQTGAAVFASFDRALASHATLSVGLRGDRVETENKGGFFGDRSTSHSALSGHAAVTVGPFSNVTTTFQVARGFRDPFLSDRYFRGPSGRGFVIGNPDLEPERSLQFDASARWTSKGRSVALFAYHYQIDDLVERFRPANDFFFRNRGEATVEGIELEAQAPLGYGLSLELAAAVARGEAEDGTPIDDIAAPNATTTLRWAGERGFAFARTLVVLEDDEPGPVEVERPGHSVFDLGGGFRINPKLEIRALARNLTDRRYRDSADEVASLARGRSFSLGLVGRY